MARERDYALVGVVRVDPVEALRRVRVLPQRRLRLVERVQGRGVALLVGVALVLLRQEVLDALVVAPLDELAKLVAHEVELAARVRHLVQGKRAHARELAPVVARHPGDERALAVDHLVVAERQDEVLVELVHGREGQELVVAGAVREVGLHVVQRIVHPAHVPLEVESQAAVGGGVRHERPRRGLLRDHHHVRVVLAHGVVARADEVDGRVVLLRPARVELLLAGVVDAEVEVQHGRDAVHADAVCVVLAHPVQQVGRQEVADLVLSEVELERAPVGVLLLLVQLVAVEVHQAVLVAAEAAGHPVQDHADARLVAGVHKVLELPGVSVAAGGREVARDLVAPRAVKRVLHHGQDLYVRVAHLLHVIDQLHGELVVGEVAAGMVVGVWVAVSGEAVRVALPAAKVALEDVERPLEEVLLGAGGHVLLVLPLIAGDIRGARRRPRGALRVERVRVGLVQQVAVGGLDQVLVELALRGAGHEAVPHAAGGRARKVGGLRVPVVEVADHANALDVRRPHGKPVALDAVLVARVRAELLVAAVPHALAHKVQVVVGKKVVGYRRAHATILRLRHD